jgi:hypothetical protein
VSQRRFARFVASRNWIYAKSMPEWPHEYTSRPRDPPIQVRRFEWAVLYIKHNGVRMKFKPTGSRCIYFDHVGFRYWTMTGFPPMTRIINRALISECARFHEPIIRESRQ